MKDHDLIDEFLSFATKPDISNCSRKLLIRGSLNTVINDAERVGSRKGYTLLGIAGTSGTPCESGFDWSTSTETDLPLRGSGTVLEVYLGTIGTRVFDSWETVEDGFSSVAFVFDTYWDNTEKEDRLIFCNGTDNMFDWSGAVATYSSSTVATITIEGTDTAASLRFLTAGTRQLRIKDSGGTWRTFTYTGGETTQTLTGVTPDPTAFTFNAGAPIFQEVITTADEVEADYLIDMVRVVNNQAIVGSRTDRRVFFSENDDIHDFTPTSPHLEGDPAVLTLDQCARAIRVMRDFILFFTDDYIYRTEFHELDVSGSLVQTVKVQRLKTANGQGALSHNLSEETENGIVYVSKGQEFLLLQDANDAEKPIIENLSDIIKPTFDDADFTNGQIKKHKNRIYISAPADSMSYIFETRLGLDGSKVNFWQPPQTIPARAWAIIDDEIHAHSAQASETYKLFDGFNDNTQPILARAFLAKYNGGKRSQLKSTTEIFSEGYISSNTTISVMYLFEVDGGDTNIVEEIIDGSDGDILFSLDPDPSLGTDSLGDRSLGGGDVDELIPKFRIIHEVNPEDFFDYETRFETNAVDQEWSLLATGPAVELSDSFASAIKQ